MTAALISLLLRVAPYVIGALVALSAYEIWHHKVYKEGEDHQIAICADEKAEVRKESTDTRLKKEREVWDAKIEDSERYLAAIGIYAQINNDLTADRDRHINDGLRVRTKGPYCSGDSMPRKANDTKKYSGSSGTVYATELEPTTARAIRDNAYEVAMGAAACEQLLEAVKREFEVK